MSHSTMTYVLSHIHQNIPPQLLELAFKPNQYSTTIEQRIISQIVEGPIMLDTNLIGGKRRDIYLKSAWRKDLMPASPGNIYGTGVEGTFYVVPPEARENRNISSVIGITPYMGSGMSGNAGSFNGAGGFGNTATGMLSQMLNTRTFAQYPMTPTVSLEGTNTIKFYPELMTEGVAISVMLEYDSEFLNMNQSAILAMRNLCLCAVQRYIGTNLRVPIDETEVVAGMEIGVIKDLVVDYIQKGEQYDALLMKLKGAMTYDPNALRRIIYHAL